MISEEAYGFAIKRVICDYEVNNSRPSVPISSTSFDDRKIFDYIEIQVNLYMVIQIA
jgi:hypothetical protein